MNYRDLQNISNLSQQILVEGANEEHNVLNRWPYTSPYLQENDSQVYENHQLDEKSVSWDTGRNASGVSPRDAATRRQAQLQSSSNPADQVRASQISSIRGNMRSAIQATGSNELQSAGPIASERFKNAAIRQRGGSPSSVPVRTVPGLKDANKPAQSRRGGDSTAQGVGSPSGTRGYQPWDFGPKQNAQAKYAELVQRKAAGGSAPGTATRANKIASVGREMRTTLDKDSAMTMTTPSKQGLQPSTQRHTAAALRGAGGGMTARTKFDVKPLKPASKSIQFSLKGGGSTVQGVGSPSGTGRYTPGGGARYGGAGIGLADSYDLYDIILSHLLDEGYAETLEQAQVIMTNMSEEWRESIVEGDMNTIPRSREFTNPAPKFKYVNDKGGMNTRPKPAPMPNYDTSKYGNQKKPVPMPNYGPNFGRD